MNPQLLHAFLEDVFAPIQPTSEEIGQVRVHANPDIVPDESDRRALHDQLIEAIRAQQLDPEELKGPQGLVIKAFQQYPVLAKYVESLSLHAEPRSGSWVQVMPPGVWL